MLLRVKAGGTKIMNVLISVLYSEGYWIVDKQAMRLGKLLRKFLRKYQFCAWHTLQLKLNRFMLVPKAHMLSHCAEELIAQAAKAKWVQNPLATSNQVQEDFIGRPSRLSRRVHAGLIHTRVMERSLLASFQNLFP